MEDSEAGNGVLTPEEVQGHHRAGAQTGSCLKEAKIQSCP